MTDETNHTPGASVSETGPGETGAPAFETDTQTTETGLAQPVSETTGPHRSPVSNETETRDRDRDRAARGRDGAIFVDPVVPVSGLRETETGDRDRSPRDRYGTIFTAPPRSGPAHAEPETGTETTSAPRWLQIVDWAITAPLTLICGGFAAGGQHITAREIHIDDPWAWFATGVFELMMISFLVHGYRRARENLSPVLSWSIGIAIGVASIYAQLLHTTDQKQEMFYGGASAMVLILWLNKFYDSYRAVLRHRKRVIVPVGKYGRVWVLSFPRAWRAMLIGTNIQSDDIQLTLRLATIYRAVRKTVQLASEARVKAGKSAIPKELVRITAWNAVYDDPQVKMPIVELPDDLRIAGVTLVHEEGPAVIEVQRARPLPAAPIDAEIVEEPPTVRRRTPPPSRPQVRQPRQQRELPPAPDATAPDEGEAAELDEELWAIRYSTEIFKVREYLASVDKGGQDAWKTRTEPVTVGLIKAATGLTGKETILKIRNAIEHMSDREYTPKAHRPKTGDTPQ